MNTIIRGSALVLFGFGCIFGLAAGELPASQQRGCTAGQDWMWAPAVDAEGNLSFDPPQHDEQILYLAIHPARADTPCDTEQLFSFAWPVAVSDPAQCGLAVNVQGHAEPFEGGCRRRGDYRNQDVAGMHQGWLGAIKKAWLHLARIA